MPNQQEIKPRLLVMASTYPRWAGDHEPGFAHELSKRLTERFKVTVLCPHATGAKPQEILDGVEIMRYRYAPQRLERLVNDGGIVTNLRRHRWMALLLPSFFIAQLIYATVFLLRQKPTAIHAHWIIPQAFIAVLAKMLSGRRTPILVTSHGADLYALNGSLMRRIKRWTLQHCAKATVVSQAMLEPLHALGMPAERTTIAPMGVDMDKFHTHSGNQRNPCELLFVGRLVEKKGLRHLLDALPLIIEQHPQTSLTIIGFGPELAERQQQAQQLGIDSRVQFIGACPQSELPTYYRRAAMLVAPFVQADSGDREGLGLVSVEALACGCPVVTTRIDAVKEVFDGQWPPYLATSGDAPSLAEQVIKALHAPDQVTAWVAAQKSSLIRRFSWQAVANGYSKILKTMARKPLPHQGHEP